MRQGEVYIETSDSLPASGTVASGVVSVANTAASATYAINYISSNGGRDYYRILATGYGARKLIGNVTQTNLESVVWVQQ